MLFYDEFHRGNNFILFFVRSLRKSMGFERMWQVTSHIHEVHFINLEFDSHFFCYERGDWGSDGPATSGFRSNERTF